MDQRERVNDGEEAIRTMLDGLQSRMWTALPGIIQSFDATKMTCSVQPAISATQTMPDGSTKTIQMPVLVDCPVVFPGAGGWWLTFTLEEDDEVLVVFASRCINAWAVQGGVQPQEEFRMHDLSDGFVIAGVASKPNVPTSVSTSGPELRNSDGTIKIATTATGFKITGDLDVTGRVIGGFGTPDQVGLQTHTHPSNGAPPTPGT